MLSSRNHQPPLLGMHKPASVVSRSAKSEKSDMWMSSRSVSMDAHSGAECGWARASCQTPSLLPGDDDKEGLPGKQGTRLARFLRYNFFSTYRIIFTVVALLNALALGLLAARKTLDYDTTASAVAVNLLVALFMRLDYAINLLFMVFCHIPKSSPLWLRCACARIYGYGGMHSGCATAAVVWYAIYIYLVVASSITGTPMDAVSAATSFATFGLFMLILVFSHPSLRARLHNWFECTHRFAGWTVVALFWVQTLSLTYNKARTSGRAFGPVLMCSVTFWCLVLITLLLIYPWTRLRLRQIQAERLSPHAIRLHFSRGRVQYGMALKLADKPLQETHPFAVIPRPNGAEGFSVLVSHAGDWTRRIIDHPPPRMWTRGIPQYGVLRVAAMFKPVLIVATGSGIGPCLSLFIAKPHLSYRVLWSTRAPLATYGADVVQRVMQADPRANIIDTSSGSRPDLVVLSHTLYKASSCEAVVVISNHKVTRKVVYGLETRGVPAFGPIFDS